MTYSKSLNETYDDIVSGLLYEQYELWTSKK
jgi:hypothetical protein